MAVSVVLHFNKPVNESATKIYDAIVEEMGVQDNPAKGAIYHWCAPRPDGGLLICDVWETRDDFERFSQEKIGPLTQKHGLPPPQIEFSQVYKIINGKLASRKGTGVFAECKGDPDDMLRGYDEANAKMGIVQSPPQGLVFHYSMKTPSGLRVIDHWASRQDFDRFVESQLQGALQAAGLPRPEITFYDIHNTIDARTVTKI